MRIRIEIKGKEIFRTQVTVRITDVNYGNHTGNDSLVGIIHEARALWLKSHGLTELKAGNTGMIMTDLVVEFKAESGFGDLLEIILYTDNVTNRSFDILYEVNVAKAKVIAKAKTGMLCFDYDAKKVATMSPELSVLLD